MVQNIAPYIQILFTIVIVIFIVMSNKNWKSLTDLYNKRINRLVLILDMIIMGGNINPVASIVIDKLKTMDIKDLPKSNNDLFTLSVSAHTELLMSMRNSLVASIKLTEDPEERDRLEKIMSETDVISTMISTLGPESSPDYVETVNKTILDCRLRMADILGEGI